MYSNPLLADTDGDSIADAVDHNPLVKDKSEIVLWKSLNPAGRLALKDEKGLIQVNNNGAVKTTKAEDMGINDENETTLRQKQNYEINKNFIDDLISYGNETEESIMWENFQKLIEIGCYWPKYKASSFPLSPAGVIDTFSPEYLSENLAVLYNGRFMLEHFQQGDGVSFYPNADFLNAMLKYGEVAGIGNGIENSVSNVMAQVKNFVINSLESNRGELSVLEYSLKNELRYLEQDLRYQEQEKIQKGSGQPPLIDNATADYHKNISKAEFLFGSYILSGGRKSPLVAFNGLGILIHDFHGYEVTIHDYKLENGKFSGKIHFKYYDHFGLDLNDVLSYSSGIRGVIGKYFRDWYCLQHMQRFEGKYKPFINYFDFEDIEFSGTVKAESEDIELSITGNIIDQHNGSPIQGATVKLHKKTDDTEIASAKTNSNGAFHVNDILVKYKGVHVEDDFWNTYYLTIQKIGYESDRRINSNLSLIDSWDLSQNVYNLGDIEITKVNMQNVEIESLPLLNDLNSFLGELEFGLSDTSYYNFENSDVTGAGNILNFMLSGPFLLPFSPIPIKPLECQEQIDGIPDWFDIYYNADQIEWYLENVLNISRSTVEKIKESTENNASYPCYYYRNGKYYTANYDVGGGFIPIIVSVKFDGFYYYVVYDVFADVQFPYDVEESDRRFVILDIKDYDGIGYWSIHQWYNNIPLDYDIGEIDAALYCSTAEKMFWRADYSSSVRVLEIGYNKTGDLKAQKRLDAEKAFLENYNDDYYHFNWQNNSISVDPRTTDPIPIDGLMGLSGFYIETPYPQAFRDRDYYVFSPYGDIIRVGHFYGMFSDGDFCIRDIDGDGITELIGHNINTSVRVVVYRLNGRIVETASLGYYDLDRLSPSDRVEGGKEGLSYFDEETGTFNLQYTTKINVHEDGSGYDSEQGYLTYNDLSPFVFEKYNDLKW